MYAAAIITPTHEPRNFVVREDSEDAYEFDNFHEYQVF
jgi:hypothetical protein